MYEISEAHKYCISHPPVAYYAACPFVGIYVHGIEYGIEDYVYASSEYADEKTFYHKVKLKQDVKGQTYFNIMGLRVNTDECLKINM